MHFWNLSVLFIYYTFTLLLLLFLIALYRPKNDTESHMLRALKHYLPPVRTAKRISPTFSAVYICQYGITMTPYQNRTFSKKDVSGVYPYANGFKLFRDRLTEDQGFFVSGSGCEDATVEFGCPVDMLSLGCPVYIHSLGNVETKTTQCSDGHQHVERRRVIQFVQSKNTQMLIFGKPYRICSTNRQGLHTGHADPSLHEVWKPNLTVHSHE